MREKVDYSSKSGKVLNLWRKHKNKVYAVILVIVGALGGNADRVTSLIPSNPENDSRLLEVEKQLQVLDKRITNLERPFSHDDGGADMDDIPTSDRIRLKK